MLGFLPTKAKGVQVGVDFTPTGVAVVDVSRANKIAGKVQHSDFLPAVGAAEQARVLSEWVERNGLRKADCISLIARHDVQLLQMGKPSVPEEELLQAVTWKLRDLINYDVAAAVVDVFELPLSAKSPVQHINAVVANENVVGGYVDIIKSSGLNLRAIDVHELVTRNFCNVDTSCSTTVAFLQLLDNEGLLSIYHDNNLHVTRDFKIGLLTIESAGDETESIYDNVLLELQRSMDYFESSYGMGAVQSMMIFPQTPAIEKMAAYLQNYIAYDLGFIEIADAANGQVLDKHCFSAYCAALRGVAA